MRNLAAEKDRLLKNKQTVVCWNAEMSVFFEASLKELKKAKLAGEKDLEKYGEVWREVWKNEEEVKKTNGMQRWRKNCRIRINRT